ncbi:hypothetical protein L9F63_020967, partial [Diploptera punctata]
FPVPVVGDSGSVHREGVPGSLPVECSLSTAAVNLLHRLLDPDPRSRLRSLLNLQGTAFFKDFSFSDARAKKFSPHQVLKSHFPNGPPQKQTSDIDEKEFSNFDSVVINDS